MTQHTNPIVYTELHSSDPARAEAFYTQLLGWQASTDATPAGPYTAFKDLLVGLTPPRGGVPAGWLPYVGVDDVRQATARARELGAEVLRDCVSIPDGVFSVVKDPTGGVIGLFQQPKRA